MNFGTVFKAFDTVVALREAARRFKGTPASTESGVPTSSRGITGHLEARLTNVVVAALKEAFDRDHARLELERAQIEEERRRAEEERRRAEAAMQMELRRQASERELARLRLIAVTAFVGWIASVALLIARLSTASLTSRSVLAVGWLLLLSGLGAAFVAQGRVGRFEPDGNQPLDTSAAGTASLGLVIAGLAIAAASLLF
jgi:hypothetical protein